MEIKLLEVRDSATFIPVFAMRTVPNGEEQRYLLRRSGYSSEWTNVIVGPLRCGRCEYDPYSWDSRSRTMQVAHEWIQHHFDKLKDGDVVDVQFILSETDKPKESERFGAF